MNGFSQHRSSTAAPASEGGQANQVATALAVIERVKQAVTEEMEAIRLRKPVDYDAFGARKNMGLLELNRLTSIVAKNLANATLKRSLLGLKEALEASKEALAIQLDAAKAITEIVAIAVRRGESDGTYSSDTFFGRLDK